MYETLKLIHVSAIILSICGFLIRGYWSFRESPLLDTRVVRILPHAVDTVLLISGAALVYVLKLQFLYQGWLLAKFGLLIAYIMLGAVALRPGRPFDTRQTAFAAAIIIFLIILGAAVTKSPASWLSLF